MDSTNLYSTPAPSAAGAAGVMIYMVVWLALVVLGIVSMWKIFTKAGQPGWAAIVPIYNTYIMLKIVGRPGWWLLLLLIPVVNIVIAIMVALEMAKVFGKSTTFGVVGLILFSFVGYVMLAFGSATYHPELAASASDSTAPSTTPPPAVA